MGKNTSALASRYIIDGQITDATPRQILEALGAVPQENIPDCNYDDIVDESADPAPLGEQPAPSAIPECARATAGATRRSFPLSYCGSLSRLAVASAALDILFRKGSFKLGDITVDTMWEWDEGRIGSAASFYESVSCAAEYIEGLGLKLRSYGYKSTDSIRLKVAASIVGDAGNEHTDTLFEEGPFSSNDPHLESGRLCPENAVGTSGNWLIYIPFDICRYRLGGSLLSQEMRFPGGKSPDLSDPDYFIDCYEVVRELIEDGFAKSGTAVGDGGLMTALGRHCRGKAVKADISGIMHACEESDPVKVLFGEIPGAIIEIQDSDFDYLDVELLLQDVAYYPLGQFSGADGELEIDFAGRYDIQGILQSLIHGASEGED